MFVPCLEDPLNEGILEEFEAAMKCLGVVEFFNAHLQRDVLEYHYQEIRDHLHRLKVSFNPDVVFCPSVNDLHQDHRAVANACLTIFRDSATLLSYENVRSTIDFKPTLYVALSKEDLINKNLALSKYETQTRRFYFKPEIFEAQALIRGSQIFTPYAEAFEVMRLIDR